MTLLTELLVLQKPEPLSMTQGFLLMIVVMIVTFAVLGIGAYLFIKFIAKILNSRRDEWAATAASLGLTVDQASGAINKDMVGTINGHNVRVTKYSVQKGEYSADHYAAVTIEYDSGLPFSFSIKKHETLWNKLGDLLSADESNFAGLESDFDLEISDANATMQLLNAEIPGGNAPTLLGEINLWRREHHRVILSDRSVTISEKVGLADSTAVGPAIDRCIYVVERIKAAAKAIATA